MQSDSKTSDKEQQNEMEESRVILNTNLANVALMFSTPVRLIILNQLAQAPRTVEELSNATQQSMANVSQHLAKLKSAHLVDVRKQGLQRVYSLSSPTVQKVVIAMQELAREISAAVAAAEDVLVAPELRATGEVEHILTDVAARRADLIDVRTSHEQAYSPVDGALRIPVQDEKDLEKVFQATSKEKPVYVFCRGAYCITASRTAEYLRSKGIQAWCLRETALELNDLREPTAVNKKTTDETNTENEQ